MIKLSVILPTYNESSNIVRLVAEIRKSIRPPWNCDVIVVDDDSTDGTYEAVQMAYAVDPEVKAIRRTADRGLAKSIRAGIEAASGEYVLVMDTDFTHRPDEIPLMLHLVPEVDLVSGSRFCAGGRMDDTAHYLASFVYNLFIRIVLRTQIQDNLGGFWVARAETVKSLPFDAIFFGYGDYYFRLLHHLQQRGLRLVELPSHYCERAAGGSKSNFLRLLFKYSAQALALALKKERPQP